jgi:cyclophilin family peptidyl-prolyl cis-trans isomerase
MRKLLLMSLGALALLVPVAAQAQAQAPANPRLADERVLLRTNRGDLVLGLYPDVAPKTVAQILKLVRLGVYDSVYFHRVEPNFVAQVTNAQNRKTPLSPEQQAAITKLPAELSSIPHKMGVLSMAREDNDVNSAETSFSILIGSAPHLDGKYTVFGRVIWGLPMVTGLATEPRDEHNAPRTPCVIEKAEVLAAADVARMMIAGDLRKPIPLTTEQLAASAKAAEQAPAAATGTAVATGISTISVVGILLMALCNLAAFFLAGRLSTKTLGALNILSVLIGAFTLFAELGSLPRRTPVMGAVLLFGLVAAFKLVNKFETPPRVERKA